MADPPPIDPAVVDRGARYIGPIASSSLPERAMTIAGITPKAGARILSKDPSGPATRLLDIPPGWRTEAAGAFTADIEVFVIEGELTIDDETAGPHSLVRMGEGEQVKRMSADGPVQALMFTAAAVRFDLGEFPGGAHICSFQDLDWVPDQPGMVSKTWAGPDITSRLVMAGHVDGLEWTRHETWSERYVVAGVWRESAQPAGDPVPSGAMPEGTYVCRAAGVPFGGPDAGTDVTALLIDRVVGPWQPMRVDAN